MNDIQEYYDSHGKKVYYYLLGIVHNKDLAEELTQETFYQAMKSISNYRGDCKPSVWLCQIAKHVWYRYLDKNKNSLSISMESMKEESLDSFDLTKKIIERSEKIELYKRIQSLEKDMKEVVYLRLVSDLSFAEIGEIMEKSDNWARVTFYRAKRKLMEGDFK